MAAFSFMLGVVPLVATTESVETRPPYFIDINERFKKPIHRHQFTFTPSNINLHVKTKKRFLLQKNDLMDCTRRLIQP